MAYMDNANARNQRAAAAIAVALLQGAAILALINGLAVKFIERPAPPHIEGEQIPLGPPPPLPPPKMDELVRQEREVVRTPVPRPPVDLGDFSYKPVDLPLPPQPKDLGLREPPAPSPTPSALPRAARPKGDTGSWVTPDDYPARDLREGNQGVTGFRLAIGADGKVQSCTITRSSGFDSLDAAACGKLMRRARFSPATEGGVAVPSEYASAIRWVIPE